MPMDVFKKKFDEALLKFGFKDTDLTAHKQSFYNPDEHLAGSLTKL
jgi:hypothetical protein